MACPRIGLIVPGQTIACFSQSARRVAGQYENIGTVNATSLAGQPVTDSDPSHYFGVQGGIEHREVHRTATTPTSRRGRSSPSGGAVTWTYVVTNTGNIALNNIVVVDLNRPSRVSCPADDLTRWPPARP